MQLSVVIPAYNEAHRIVETIATVRAFLERSFERSEIIVVDDGSEDPTASLVAREIERVSPRNDFELKLLQNGRNRGKGHSVARGMLEASLDPILFTDADLSTPIEEAERLYRAISEGADIAIASRRPTPGLQVRRVPYRRFLAAGFRFLVKTLAIRGFYDTQCGFKMFRRDAARAVFPRQTIEGWGFDVEVLFVARRLGLKIVEVPVSWRESPDSRLKLRTPVSMLFDLLRIRRNVLLGRYG